jgi:hypothetical protein
MHQYETLQQLAGERGERLRREAAAERLALETSRGTRHPRTRGVGLAAALRLRSALGSIGNRSTAYRPSA